MSRRRFDVVAYTEGRLGTASPTAVTIASAYDAGEQTTTALEQARKRALQFLNTNYREILADPFSHQPEVERAIYEAVSEVELSGIEARLLREELTAHILGAGPLEPLFRDPDVTEIMVVGRRVWVERGGVIHQELSLSTEEEAMHLAERMAERAGHRFQLANPIVDFGWEDGSRVNLVHPSVSASGVAITIRKPDRSRPLDMASLIESGALSKECADFLVTALLGRLNILISGTYGAGKTTLMRALAQEAFRGRENERLIVIEDTEELRLPHPHTVSLVAARGSKHRDADEVTVHDLAVASKRMRPDRIFVGEVRDVEALDLLDMAVSEAGGILATIHLRGPEELAPRLHMIAQKAGRTISAQEMVRQAHSAIDLVVHLTRDGTGARRVSRVTELLPEGRVQDIFAWSLDRSALERIGTLSTDRVEKIRYHLGGKPLETLG